METPDSRWLPQADRVLVLKQIRQHGYSLGNCHQNQDRQADRSQQRRGFVERSGLIPLEISFNHVERSKSLPLHHGNPFDRMLISQALAEDMTLVSKEAVFDRYGVKRVWE